MQGRKPKKITPVLPFDKLQLIYKRWKVRGGLPRQPRQPWQLDAAKRSWCKLAPLSLLALIQACDSRITRGLDVSPLHRGYPPHPTLPLLQRNRAKTPKRQNPDPEPLPLTPNP